LIGKKEIPEWKINEVNDLTGLLQQYKTVAVIEVIRMSDRQIQQIRKLLRAKAIIKMSKKNLQLRALEQYKKQSNKENLEY
jgi:large subunit ribosomal protein L10